MLGHHKFGRKDMIALFEKVGELCKKKDLVFEIAIYGGSALMLQPSIFSERRVTEDIDYTPLEDEQEAVMTTLFDEASNELGYENRVFRDDVKLLISTDPEYEFFAQYPKDSGAFRVFTATPNYLLAMKSMAMRSSLVSSDVQDFYYLVEKLDISTFDELKEVIEPFFPLKKLPRSNELTIKEVLEYKQDLNGEPHDEHDLRFIAR